MFLYHMYAPDENKEQMRKALEYGLTPDLTSRWLGIGGGGSFYPDIINKYQLESKSEDWVDFSKGIRVEFSPHEFGNYLKFPVFTDKILVFNMSISPDLFSYIEDEYVMEETGKSGTMISPETPEKEVLIKQY